MFTERAHAKLNLGLNIVGVKNGLHLIDSVFVPVENLFDIVSVSPREDDAIFVTYLDGRKYENDTTLKMAKLLQEIYKIPGLDITIDKVIPEGAGLGGSSADAGALCRIIEKNFNIKIDIDVMLKVGSDVPYCAYDKPARVKGIGEVIEPLNIKCPNFTIIIPNETVNTALCYRTYDQIGGAVADIDKIIDDLKNNRETKFINSLEKAARSISSGVDSCFKMLENENIQANLTGSGSAIFTQSALREIIIERLNNYNIIIV